MPGRPTVSVVVPFAGTAEAAHALAAALSRIELRTGDEIIVADNTPWQMAGTELAGAPLRVVPAPAERSSYHARNCGAAAATGEWLAFMDADCTPRPDILDAFFTPPPGQTCGAVAGRIAGSGAQDGLIPGWTVSRRWLDQAAYLSDPSGLPFAVTANVLVRRAAWESVGGFQEGIRSGADYEFCRRVQEAGWTLEWREDAVVEHHHRESLKALLRQSARYGASRAWLNRRYGPTFPAPEPRWRTRQGLARVKAGLRAGSRTDALYGAIDIAVEWALTAGYLSRNRPLAAYVPQPRAEPERRVVVLTDRFPELSETFVVNEVRALRRLGWWVRVEADRRADHPVTAAQRELGPDFIEDDGTLRRALDLAWLVGTRPLRVLADRRERRTWAAEEDVRPLRALASAARRIAAHDERHIHVHFAGPAALHGMRLARLLGRSWSVTAHAYEIYREPRNLAAKLTDAAFATSGCDYTVRDLRRAAPDADVHRIVMGVEGDSFRRRTPHPATGPVLAVGRLVEKKGFVHLVDAAAALRDRGVPVDVRIIGDGPQRADLEAQVARLGLDGAVTLLGSRDPDAVREALEGAAVLAMPCVVAADGDRDSMPVVVKEALAMEVPVVASDEVGLPELVQPGWGRLVAPGDAEALAGALAELLALGVRERAAMGRRGREHVLAACSVERETARLAELIARAAAR